MPVKDMGMLGKEKRVMCACFYAFAITQSFFHISQHSTIIKFKLHTLHIAHILAHAPMPLCMTDVQGVIQQ